MKKLLVACILLLASACTSVTAKQEIVNKEITVSGLCQTEKSGRILYDAILKGQNVVDPLVGKECQPIKVKAKLLRVIDNQKDSDKDDFLFVEVCNIPTCEAKAFGIHWPLHDEGPSKSARNS